MLYYSDAKNVVQCFLILLLTSGVGVLGIGLEKSNFLHVRLPVYLSVCLSVCLSIAG